MADPFIVLSNRSFPVQFPLIERVCIQVILVSFMVKSSKNLAFPINPVFRNHGAFSFILILECVLHVQTIRSFPEPVLFRNVACRVGVHVVMVESILPLRGRREPGGRLQVHLDVRRSFEGICYRHHFCRSAFGPVDLRFQHVRIWSTVPVYNSC